MADIHFGTDGWRAIIGEDFTDDNLVRVVDAAARVFKEDAVAAGRPADAPGTLIVGHDCRQDEMCIRDRSDVVRHVEKPSRSCA